MEMASFNQLTLLSYGTAKSEAERLCDAQSQEVRNAEE
jgi:hypothetical protein